MELILTERAYKDLAEIKEYISLDNPTAAKELLSDFEKALDNLALMPKIGHINQTLTNKNVRFLNVKKYVIIYKINDDNIAVIRISSTYRDIYEMLSDY
ncbi:MAG: type II toxin-antitoxin system RelE/ParE family toxin [bacterium]